MKTIIVLLFVLGILGMKEGEDKRVKTIENSVEISDSTKVVNENFRKLTDFENFVINEKGTEIAFTGKYHNHKEKGTYHCKQCNAALFKSSHKFDSYCGWPSFDNEIKDAVKKTIDSDGMRTEITCSNCGGHLGHVFYGEGFTLRNTRHCVNSTSLHFESKKKQKKED